MLCQILLVLGSIWTLFFGFYVYSFYGFNIHGLLSIICFFVIPVNFSSSLLGFLPCPCPWFCFLLEISVLLIFLLCVLLLSLSDVGQCISFSFQILCIFQWLMPLASQYLLLVLYNVQAYIKMLFRVIC